MMQRFIEFGALEIIVVWAICLGLGALAMALAKRWLWATALAAVILGVILLVFIRILYDYEHARLFTAFGRFHYWSYLVAASIGLSISGVALLKHAPKHHTTDQVLLLRWVVTPIVLASIVWLAMAAYSPALSWGLVELRTLIVVSFAIPVATIAASRYEQLEGPGPIDHVRQAGLLYVFLFVSVFEWGSSEPDINRLLLGDVWFEVDAHWVFVLAVSLNIAVNIVWSEVRRVP